MVDLGKGFGPFVRVGIRLIGTVGLLNWLGNRGGFGLEYVIPLGLIGPEFHWLTLVIRFLSSIISATSMICSKTKGLSWWNSALISGFTPFKKLYP